MQLSPAEQKWFDLIQEARSSGLNDKAWCLQNNVPTSTFYYHVRKLRSKVSDIPAARSTVVPEIHEVVKVEILDDKLPASSYQMDHEQNVPAIESDFNGLKDCVFSARLHAGIFTVDISNGASEQVILSVVKALRQPC